MTTTTTCPNGHDVALTWSNTPRPTSCPVSTCGETLDWESRKRANRYARNVQPAPVAVIGDRVVRHLSILDHFDSRWFGAK